MISKSYLFLSDIDGLHIRSLLITFLYKYMKPLIINGYLYAAVPPLYKIIYKNKAIYLKDDNELNLWRNSHQSNCYDIQRFKGLGEMSPEELWQTILDPEHRTLKQITIDDVKDAEEALAVCMGNDVGPRRQFIEENAYKVEQLNL